MDTQRNNRLRHREILEALGDLRFPEHPREQLIIEAVRFGTANNADEIRGTDDYE